jgi:ABC-type phosphate transport system substrate-binding protein
VVVVSAKSPITSLRADQVANIFLGKTAVYPTGDAAVPLDMHEDAAVRQEFYAKVARQPPALLKAYWSKLLFTGKGRPPKEMASAEAVKKIVADDPRFIGYIDRSAVDSSVKVVLVPQ